MQRRDEKTTCALDQAAILLLLPLRRPLRLRLPCQQRTSWSCRPGSDRLPRTCGTIPADP